MGELFAQSRILDVDMDRVPLTDSEAERFLLHSGDLLFARQSLVLEGAGKCSIFLGDDEPVTFESHITRVRLRQDEADPLYYFYYLQSSHGRSVIRSIVEQGAGASGIRGSDLAKLRVPWRPVREQRRIAAALGALDDKIALNRQMSATLETMSRAVFNSWFVDFDLFGGTAPEDWPTVPLDGAVEVLAGGTPRTGTAEYWNGPIPWFSVKDAPDPSDIWVLRTERTITQAGVDNSAAQILPVGTTILSARGTVGKLALVGIPMAMNQSCFGLKSRHGDADAFTYFAVGTLVSDLQHRAHGSVFDTINRDTLSGMSVLLPPRKVVAGFEAVAAPMLGRIKLAIIESRTLTELRDTLLPRFMSGELRVRDAERIAAEAGP